MNSKLRQYGLMALAGALTLASPGVAQEPSSEVPEARSPVANLIIRSGARATADWYGRGAVKISTPLCIASSTGSFRLNVLPSSGLAALTASVNATIALERDGSLLSSQSFDGRTPVSFVGRIDPMNSDCNGGDNSQLVITLPEQSLASVTAGQYFDQLQLELEAI